MCDKPTIACDKELALITRGRRERSRTADT